jgi:hypothetical protein
MFRAPESIRWVGRTLRPGGARFKGSDRAKVRKFPDVKSLGALETPTDSCRRRARPCLHDHPDHLIVPELIEGWGRLCSGELESLVRPARAKGPRGPGGDVVHVQPGAGDAPGTERIDECVRVDERSAGRVDQVGGGLHERELGPPTTPTLLGPSL